LNHASDLLLKQLPVSPFFIPQELPKYSEILTYIYYPYPTLTPHAYAYAHSAE